MKTVQDITILLRTITGQVTAEDVGPVHRDGTAVTSSCKGLRGDNLADLNAIFCFTLNIFDFDTKTHTKRPGRTTLI